MPQCYRLIAKKHPKQPSHTQVNTKTPLSLAQLRGEREGCHSERNTVRVWFGTGRGNVLRCFFVWVNSGIVELVNWPTEIPGSHDPKKARTLAQGFSPCVLLFAPAVSATQRAWQEASDTFENGMVCETLQLDSACLPVFAWRNRHFRRFIKEKSANHDSLRILNIT